MILLLLTSVRNCCTFAKRYPQKRYALFSSYGNYKSKHREAAGFATGPDESVYAGKTYKLSITFPADYPSPTKNEKVLPSCVVSNRE